MFYFLDNPDTCKNVTCAALHNNWGQLRNVLYFNFPPNSESGLVFNQIRNILKEQLNKLENYKDPEKLTIIELPIADLIITQSFLYNHLANNTDSINAVSLEFTTSANNFIRRQYPCLDASLHEAIRDLYKIPPQQLLANLNSINQDVLEGYGGDIFVRTLIQNLIRKHINTKKSPK